MAVIWKCDTPVEPAHYLRRMGIWRDIVVYTKYIVNKMGMMPCDQLGRASAVIKEFKFPPVPNFYLSPDLSPTDVLDYGSTVLVNSQSSGAICRWRPGSSKAQYIQADSNAIAFRAGRLAVDSRKQVWAPCSIVLGWSGPFPRVEPGLARLRIRSRSVTCEYWQLPTEFVSPMGLWVDDLDRCWFSVLNSNSPAQGYSFGRLDPGTNELKGYGIGSTYGNVHADIEGTGKGEEVWITRHAGSGRVYRFSDGRPGVEVFDHSAVKQPLDIAFGDKGAPWFGCRGGQLATIIGDAGSKEPVTEDQWTIAPKPMEVRIERISVLPLGGTAVSAG